MSGLWIVLGSSAAPAFEAADPVSQVVPVAGSSTGGGLLVFNDISRNPSCSLTRNVANLSDRQVELAVVDRNGVELQRRTIAASGRAAFVVDHLQVTIPLYLVVDGAQPVEIAQVGPVEGCDAVTPPGQSPPTTTVVTTPVAPPEQPAPPVVIDEPPATTAPGGSSAAPEGPGEPVVPVTALDPSPLPPPSPPPPSPVPPASSGAALDGPDQRPSPRPLPITGIDPRPGIFAGLSALGAGLALVGTTGAARRRPVAPRPVAR